MTIWMQWRRWVLLALLGLVLAGAAVAMMQSRDGTAKGATNMSSSSPTSRATSGLAPARDLARPTATAPEKSSAASGSAAGAATVGPTPAQSPAAPVTTGPQVIRTAEVQLRVRNGFQSAFDRVTHLATDLGGFVTTSSSSTQDGRSSGDVTIRIPADRFDEARRRVSELGTVESTQIGGNDVGGQLVDLDARLKTLHAEEDSLNALLGQSHDIGQILQVRDRLTGVRTEIEQLTGQQAMLKDQVAYATIHVALHEPGATPPLPPKPEPRWSLARNVRTAVHATEAVAGGMLVVLGVLVPFLLLALLAWPVLVLQRRRARTT